MRRELSTNLELVALSVKCQNETTHNIKRDVFHMKSSLWIISIRRIRYLTFFCTSLIFGKNCIMIVAHEKNGVVHAPIAHMFILRTRIRARQLIQRSDACNNFIAILIFIIFMGHCAGRRVTRARLASRMRARFTEEPNFWVLARAWIVLM